MVVFLCRLVSCGLRTIVGCGGCGFFVDLCCLLLFWVFGMVVLAGFCVGDGCLPVGGSL